MTEQDLLEAIRSAHAIHGNDDNAMTVNEIADATGHGVNQVRAKIKSLMAENKIQPVWVYRETITTPLTGRMMRVPAYVAIQNQNGSSLATSEQA